MELYIFETGLTQGGKGFSTFFFSSYIEQGVTESHGARIVVVGSREGAHPRFFFVFIHKTRGFEWSNRAYKRVSRESLWSSFPFLPPKFHGSLYVEFYTFVFAKVSSFRFVSRNVYRHSSGWNLFW